MNSRILVLACLSLGSMSTVAAVPPPLSVEYSADRRIESGEDTIEGRVLAAPGMERSELAMRGMSAVMILRTDRKLGWMVLPAQRMYQETSLAQATQQTGAVAIDQVELTVVGDETVSGVATTKYRFVSLDRSTGGFLWYSAEGIPVKMDVLSKSGGDKSRTTVTLHNIQVGPQDRAAFEVPAGFTKLPGGGMPRLSR
jgi:hypothetical protein